MKILPLSILYTLVVFSSAAGEPLLEKFLPLEVNFFNISLQGGQGRNPLIQDVFIQKSGDSFLYSSREDRAKPDFVRVEEVGKDFLRIKYSKINKTMFWLRPEGAGGQSYKLYAQERQPGDSTRAVGSCRRININMVQFLHKKHDGKPRGWISMPYHTSKLWLHPSEQKGHFKLKTQGQAGMTIKEAKMQQLDSKGFPSYQLSFEGSPPVKITFNHWNSLRFEVDGSSFDASPSIIKEAPMGAFSSKTHAWHELLAPRQELTDARYKEMEQMYAYVSGRLPTSFASKEWIPSPSVKNTDDYFRNNLKCDPPAFAKNWQLLAASEAELKKKWWFQTPVWISKEWQIMPGKDFQKSLQEMKEPAIVFIPEPMKIEVVLPGAVVEHVPFLKSLSTREFKVLQPK